MRCLLRPPQARESGGGSRLVRAFAILFALLISAAAISAPAHAQSPSPSPSPTPTPSPSPTPVPTPTKTEINSDISVGSTVLDLGSSFLERLGNQATNGFVRGLRNNPGGGGASETTEGPRYRTWGELYGITMTTGPQADYFGDKRRTMGGVAGFGARVAPGINVGFSVDQSRTTVDVPLALQSATLDVTQLGVNASIDKGPWT